MDIRFQANWEAILRYVKRNMDEKVNISIIKRIYRYILLKAYAQVAFILFISSAITVFIYFLNRNSLIKISITTDIITEYTIVLASILGPIAAIMVGFFFFKFQSIESQRQTWYLATKKEIDNLVEILHNLSSNYPDLCEHLNRCIVHLEAIKANTCPFWGKEDLEIIQAPSNYILQNEKINQTEKNIYKFIHSILRIEEYNQNLRVLTVGIHISDFILKSIKKLFILFSCFYYYFCISP